MNDLLNRMYGNEGVTIQAFKQLSEGNEHKYLVAEGRFQSISFVATDEKAITITYKSLQEEIYPYGVRKLEDSLFTLTFPAWLTSVSYDFENGSNHVVTISYFGKEPEAPLYKITITWKNQ